MCKKYICILFFFQAQFKMGTRVYIGRLSYHAREKDVERFFKGFGKVRDVMLKNGYGFVVSYIQRITCTYCSKYNFYAFKINFCMPVSLDRMSNSILNVVALSVVNSLYSTRKHFHKFLSNFR